MFLLVVMVCSLTACKTEMWYNSDPDNAYVELVTSNGSAVNRQSFHYINKYHNGLARALANELVLSLPEATTVSVHFVCQDCGYDETSELTVPAAEVFSCDCVDGDNSKGLKEYFAVSLVETKNESVGTVEEQ